MSDLGPRIHHTFVALTALDVATATFKTGDNVPSQEIRMVEVILPRIGWEGMGRPSHLEVTLEEHDGKSFPVDRELL